MPVKDAAEVPAARDFFSPGMAAEEHRLPHAIDLHQVADIVIGAPVGELRVVRIILGLSTGRNRYQGFWPSYSWLQPGTAVRHLVGQCRDHGVVIGMTVVAEEINDWSRKDSAEFLSTDATAFSS